MFPVIHFARLVTIESVDDINNHISIGYNRFTSVVAPELYGGEGKTVKKMFSSFLFFVAFLDGIGKSYRSYMLQKSMGMFMVQSIQQ